MIIQKNSKKGPFGTSTQHESKFFSIVKFFIIHRYHERYYPENIYHDDRSEYDEERERAPVRQQVSRQKGIHSHICVIRKLESLGAHFSQEATTTTKIEKRSHF